MVSEATQWLLDSDVQKSKVVSICFLTESLSVRMSASPKGQKKGKVTNETVIAKFPVRIRVKLQQDGSVVSSETVSSIVSP